MLLVTESTRFWAKECQQLSCARLTKTPFTQMKGVCYLKLSIEG